MEVLIEIQFNNNNNNMLYIVRKEKLIQLLHRLSTQEPIKQF